MITKKIIFTTLLATSALCAMERELRNAIGSGYLESVR
jgi:hypothetical protein